MNDKWVNGWINEWVVSGPSKHIDLVDSWNYPSELRREIKAGNKVLGVINLQVVMKFMEENKSPRESKTAED